MNLLLLLLRLLHLVLALTLPSPTTATTLALGNATDQVALLSFKALISSDPLGALTSWNGNGDDNQSHSFCQWRGVTCGGRRHPGRVIDLDLESLNLTGTMSPSLANLTFLRGLNLAYNDLHGLIPSDLGQLSHLQFLNLKYNSLQGEIPATLTTHCSRLRYLTLSNNNLEGKIPANLSRCVELQFLSFSANKLVGEIPDELGSLPNLVNLSLHTNGLTGSIPVSFGNLSSLTGIDLNTNKLWGKIPEDLCSIHGLSFFAVGENSLHGSIPHCLFNLTSISVVVVGSNQLSGTLPSSMGFTVPNLQIFQAFYNQIRGPIPSSLPNASRLEQFVIYGNEFGGTVPPNLGSLKNLITFNIGDNKLVAKDATDWDFFTSLTNCTRLKVLSMLSNKFGGKLPTSVANFSTELWRLIMAENQISGSIPSDIGRLVGLNELALYENLLTGVIPDTIGKLQSLVVLTLFENSLSGSLPAGLGNLTRLETLSLSENGLQGSIPDTFGSFGGLTYMDLSYNDLSGTVPREVVTLSTLSKKLDLSHNRLTGPLPVEVGSLKNLVYFDVSNNGLSGKIPSALGQCLLLQDLYMKCNQFDGPIPSSLSSLKGIEEIDFSHNNLSGPVPEFFGSFKNLHTLNLSFNNLEGSVPDEGVFQNVSAVSVVGNSHLCGGNPELHLKACSLPAFQKARKFSKFKVIILLTSIVLPLFLLLCFFAACYWKLKWRRREELSATSMGPLIAVVSYAELLKATNGFSSSNIIGAGKSSTVYMGTMDSDPNVVAIKVLNLQQHGGLESFMTECEALRHIRHRNLVKIITACSSIDHAGNDFKALVFEFMPNGTLDEWLHPRDNELHESRNLSLMQRLNIAIHVASALDYLHQHGTMPIVHCDLKPSNVLLDNDMVAHVGDFGLTKFLPMSSSTSFQDPSSASGINGTIGYVAPEYGMWGKASPRGDVYSYGVLLLEMFTGKRPTDDTFRDGLNLHKFVEMALPERVVDIIDPLLLLSELNGGSGRIAQESNPMIHKMVKCLAAIFRVALQCSKEAPEERIDMEEVIKELNGVQKLLLQADPMHRQGAIQLGV